MLLGLAYRGEGDEDGAKEELTLAKTTFERLGAVLDLQRASELLGESSTRRTFMFTDIVDSTKLVEVLGEAKWAKLLAWHDRTLRELIEEAGGEVIKQTGDGYFAAFQTPNAAIEAAAADPAGARRARAARARHPHRRPHGRGVPQGRRRLHGPGRPRRGADRRPRGRRRDPREPREPRRRLTVPGQRAALGGAQGLRGRGRARRRRLALTRRSSWTTGSSSSPS